MHWLDLSVEAPHFDRWTYFRGGYENVYMNFDGTVRRSQGYSTTIVFDRAIEYVDDRLVTHVDVLPTILAATGVTQVHATLDSRDLLSGHTRQTSWSTSWPTASQRTTPTPRPCPRPCERPDSAPGPAARSLAERRSSSRRRPARATRRDGPLDPVAAGGPPGGPRRRGRAGLSLRLPGVPWDAKNQAAVHTWYGRHNPRRVTVDHYRQRVRDKRITDRWPGVEVLL